MHAEGRRFVIDDHHASASGAAADSTTEGPMEEAHSSDAVCEPSLFCAHFLVASPVRPTPSVQDLHIPESALQGVTLRVCH